MALDVRNSVALVATLSVGVLSGILVGTGLAAFTARGLSEAAWVLAFSARRSPVCKGDASSHAEYASGPDRRLHSSPRPFAFTPRNERLVYVLVLVVTIGFEVPLNKQIQSWTPTSTPSGWQHIRDVWLERHILRTISSVLGFISALIALMV